MDPVLFDAYTATDDVEVGISLRRFIVARTTGSGKTQRALAWRHAVENLGVEARHYDDPDYEPMIYVSWTGDDGEYPFDFVLSETRNGSRAGRFSGPVWNAEYVTFQTVSYR